MTNLTITLNNEKYNAKLTNSRQKRLSRYIYNYVVGREGWQMAENIVENLFDAKNVNFHDPKFPFIDLIVKRNVKQNSKNDLLNVKSSRQSSLKSAIGASLRGKDPKIKFFVSLINYILRSTNTTKAGDVMLGSKIVKSLSKSHFNDRLKNKILKQYNKTHGTFLTNFYDIPTLQENVSMCFVHNPIQRKVINLTHCSIQVSKTKTQTFKDLFDRTLLLHKKKISTSEMLLKVFDEGDDFSNRYVLSTFFDDLDVKKINMVFGLNGKMSDLKNDVINQIRDLGSVKELQELNFILKTIVH